MKKISLPLAVILLVPTLYIMAFKPAAPTDSGNIGDVKYSVLEPAKFMDQNPGWVLLDGGASQQSRDLFQKSALHLQLKFPALPDARGVFIRAMNLGRGSADGDPEGDAAVGRYQGDQLKLHSHGISIAVTNDEKGTQVRGGVEDRNLSAGQTASVGGNETRPRNIALYVYVKIQ